MLAYQDSHVVEEQEVVTQEVAWEAELVVESEVEWAAMVGFMVDDKN
jgi:hypothetical protein